MNGTIAMIVDPTAPLRVFIEPGERYFVVYMLPQLLFAVWFARRRVNRRAPLEWAALSHRSTRHDLLLLAFNAALVYPVIAVVFRTGRIVHPLRRVIEGAVGRHALLSGW